MQTAAPAAQVEAGRLTGAVGTGDHHGALCAVGEGVHPQFDAVRPGGDRALVVGGQRDDRVRAGQQRQGVEAVLLTDPARTGDLGTRQHIGPGALRDVVLDCAVVGEDRGDEQVVAEHVLPVEGRGGRVVGELQHHGAHHRDTGGVRLLRGALEVRGEAVLEQGELAGDVDCLLAVVPRHAVRLAAVQAAVRGEQPELHPALEHGRGRGALEAADVMAPEPEAGQAEGEAAAQRLGHGVEVGLAVAAPVDRVLLAARRGGAGEQQRLSLASLGLQQFEDGLVEEVGVVVVHPLGVGAVVPDDVGGDALAEVGLEAVHALVEQRLQFACVPVARSGVGEVHQGHAGLPQVPLPHAAVRAPHQVPLAHALLEQRRLLRDVRVDPGGDPQPLLPEPAQHAGRVGEGVGVPGEVAPLVAAHPEAVEVEHAQRDAALGHAVDEAVDGGLVVVGGEGGGQPQAERPGRGQGGAAGERGVALKDLLRGRAVDDEELQRLVLDAELDLAYRLGAHLVADLARVVDEDAVAAVGQVEGDVLVRLLAAGAAVSLPDVDHLPVLDERGEPFPQPVHRLSYAQGELPEHEVPAVGVGDEAGAAFAHGGQHPPAGGELQVPRL